MIYPQDIFLGGDRSISRETQEGKTLRLLGKSLTVSEGRSRLQFQVLYGKMNYQSVYWWNLSFLCNNETITTPLGPIER